MVNALTSIEFAPVSVRNRQIQERSWRMRMMRIWGRIHPGFEPVPVRKPSVTGQGADVATYPILTPSDRRLWPFAADESVSQSGYSSGRRGTSLVFDHDVCSYNHPCHSVFYGQDTPATQVTIALVKNVRQIRTQTLKFLTRQRDLLWFARHTCPT